MRKDRIDAFGAAALTGFSALMGVNHVVAKLVTDGLQPVAFAGLRSLGAVLCLYLFMQLRGRWAPLRRETWGAGLVIGLLFSAEFTFLFTALDQTTVVRTSVIFYTMPLWLALAAHWMIPGERLRPVQAAGLAVAFGGVVLALVDRGGPAGAAPSLVGDLCALGAALSWAGIALCARVSVLCEEPAERQLFWQVLVSGVVLTLLAPLFGPLVRAPDWTTWAGLGFQIVVVVTLGFVLWLWLLSIYPAGPVAAFGFLTPLFGVGFGWALLDEPVRVSLLVALVLVTAGLWLATRGPKRR